MSIIDDDKKHHNITRPTSTVADSESDTTNSDYSSDSGSSAAMSTENVVDVRR